MLHLEFNSDSENEGIARIVTAAYIMKFDPDMEEMDDIKTAVSEAVTNCIVHAYHDPDGRIGDQQQRRKRHQRQRGQKNILCPAHRPVDPILVADFGKIQRQRPMDRIDAGNVIPGRHGVGGRFYHQICFLPIFR